MGIFSATVSAHYEFVELDGDAKKNGKHVDGEKILKELGKKATGLLLYRYGISQLQCVDMMR